MISTDLDDEKIAPRYIRRIHQLIKEKIYFVKCGDFVRFSRSSTTAHWLLKDLQPHCPLEMTIIKEVPGGLKLQSELEKTFKHYHHNSLWFRYEGELKEWLEDKL
jgi:hypothetical protein